jgi:hypothetical protein
MILKSAMRLICGIGAIAYLGACAKVTIKPEGGEKIATPPTFEQSKTYLWWGLSGEHTINVMEVCQGKGVEQFQSQFTFMDGLKGAITLGIWSPKTARVWCTETAK